MKNLKALVTFLILNAAFLISANAQIVYTDIPDTTINTSGGVYLLDLNNDGITDFQITHTISTTNLLFCGTATNHDIMIKSLNFNKVGGDSVINSSPYHIPPKIFASRRITLNKKINAGFQTWGADSSNLLLSKRSPGCIRDKSGNYHITHYTTGEWADTHDGYLALQLQVGFNIYYGWVRLDVASSSSFTVKDYAYKNSPGATILAGQNTTQYVAISPVNGFPFCAGSAVNVSYVKYGNFNSANIFTAELSDSAGSFSNPVTIGSIISNVSGTVSATLPANSNSGNKYRIRVRSSNPLKISVDNGSDIIINSSLADSTISASGNTNFCYGSSVLLSSLQGTGISYQWKNNGVNIPYQTTYKYTSGTSTTGNFTCQITNGCGTVISNNIITNVLPLPFAQIDTLTSSTACSGTAVTLSANAGTGLTYKWYQSYDPSNSNYYNYAGATGINYSTTSTTVGPYVSVKVRGSNGCSNYSPAVRIRFGNPVANIIANGPTTFCNGDSAILSFVDDGYRNYYTYQWRKNSVDIAGSNNFYFTVVQAGTYTLKVTNPNGNCFSVSAGKVITVSCKLINEKIAETAEHFTIYPNPATNSITIKFPSDEEGQIQIINLFGRVVETHNYASLQDATLQIDVFKYPSGIYMVRWNSGENNETKTFSVVK